MWKRNFRHRKLQIFMPFVIVMLSTMALCGAIAIYKTNGYSSQNIIRWYLTFYFVLVTVGSINGILESGLFVHSILKSMYDNIGAQANGNIWLPSICCYLIVVGYVLFIINLNMRRMRNVKPVLALNGMQNGNSKKKNHYKGDCRMQFSSMGISVRTMMLNKKGAVGIIITFIVTIFAVKFCDYFH